MNTASIRDDSEITITKGGAVCVSGRDAMAFYRAIQLRAAIRLHAKTGLIPTRGFGPTKMLAAAGAITGKAYRRGQAEAAVADLDVWIATMRAALPFSDQRVKQEGAV